MNSENNLGPSSTKDKPIIATKTNRPLATRPTARVGAENHRGAEHESTENARNSSRGSVPGRRPAHPCFAATYSRFAGSLGCEPTLAILTGGNCVFTALGCAGIVQESIPDAANYLAVEIDVEEIDDHRSPGVVVESGVRVQFAQFADDAEFSLRKRIDALRELTERRA